MEILVALVTVDPVEILVALTLTGRKVVVRRIMTALFGVSLLVLVLGATPAATIFAHEGGGKGKDGSRGDYETVVLDRTGNEVGEAELKLRRGRVKIEVETEDLAPGHVFSIWGIINHQLPISLNGFISDDDGEAEFVRRVDLGPDFDLYKFRVVIKDHGLPLPGEIELQKTTKTHGCEVKCPSVQFATFEGL